jgi:hypothetical protein
MLQADDLPHFCVFSAKLELMRARDIQTVTTQAARTGMGETIGVLALFIQTLPLTSPALTDALTTQYPWVRFLPEGDPAEFVREFLETMKACASINNFSRIEAVVNAWRSSAEIHANPQLLAHLTKPLSCATGPSLRRP